MVIKIKKNNNFVYVGGSEILNIREKERADYICSESRRMIKNLHENLDAEGINDILERWHKIGKLIQQILEKFNIKMDEMKYFWIMMYDVGKNKTPTHIGSGRNDFRLSYILSKYSLKKLKKVGSWSLWREIVGSKKVNKDSRIAEWIVDEIISNRNIKTRNDTRPFLKKVYNRLKNLDTTILSKEELFEKLKEIK